MKLELVTVVVKSPICCVAAPPKSATPMRKKESQFRRVRGFSVLRFSIQTKGRTTMVATAKRRPMNQNGPIAFIAVDCATKPPPQMAAANNNTKFACMRVIYILREGEKRGSRPLAVAFPPGKAKGHQRRRTIPLPGKYAATRRPLRPS